MKQAARGSDPHVFAHGGRQTDELTHALRSTDPQTRHAVRSRPLCLVISTRVRVSCFFVLLGNCSLDPSGGILTSLRAASVGSEAIRVYWHRSLLEATNNLCAGFSV